MIKNIILFLSIFCFFTVSVFGQKELDSIIQSATIFIYDNPKAAIKIGKSTFEKASTANTKVKALMLISSAYLSQRENEKALDYALKSKDYLEDIQDIQTKIRILNSIGMQHQQLRIYDKAIEYLDEALQLINQQGQDHSYSTELGYNYAIRGFIYRERMNCDIALSYFNRSIKQYKKDLTNSSSSANISTMMYNKGNCFLQLTQIDSARTNFIKSIEYADRINANSLYAFAKKGLSEILTLEGKYNHAIRELEDSENASKDVGDLILNQGIYKNFSDNYLAIDNKEKYQYYFKKYSEVTEQITEKEQKSIDGSIINLMEDIQEKTKKELESLKLIRWILVASILIIFVFLTRILIRKFKTLTNAKKKLEILSE